MVMVGDKELSAAREPMRGKITSGMGRSARTARGLYGLFCLHVEESPFPPKSLPRHSPTAAHRAPSPMEVHESTVAIQVQVTLGTLFSRGCLPHLFPLVEAPAAQSRGSRAQTATWR